MQSINTIVLKMVKVSKLVQRKVIPYKSNIGSGAYRKSKYFGDIPRQLFCVHRDLLLIHNINLTAEKSSKY